MENERKRERGKDFLDDSSTTNTLGATEVQSLAHEIQS